jgi:hypothetical protein
LKLYNLALALLSPVVELGRNLGSGVPYNSLLSNVKSYQKVGICSIFRTYITTKLIWLSKYISNMNICINYSKIKEIH